MIWMRKFLSQLFCKHEWWPFRCTDVARWENPPYGVWCKCVNCSKVAYRWPLSPLAWEYHWRDLCNWEVAMNLEARRLLDKENKNAS